MSAFLDDDWIERRYYGGDLPAAAERALHLAARAWGEDDVAEAHIREALALAPDHLAVKLGAYKFFFYKNRLAEAAPLALSCVEHAARQLNMGRDWRQARATDAAFGEYEAWPRFYLFALKAYGYVLCRLGRIEEGRAAVAKAADLDLADRTGSARLLVVIDRGGREDDEE